MAAPLLAAAALAVGLALVSTPSVLLRSDGTRAPEESSVWLHWADALGFASPGRHDEKLRAALDALTDSQLGQFNDAISQGGQGLDSNAAMRLASWLFAGSRTDQVERLHALVPRLEPAIRQGEKWVAVSVSVDGQFSVDDIHQGSADDCWLMAGLGSLAIMDPGDLHDRIRLNDNGTYTVTWTIAGGNLAVTVSPYLPFADAGTLAYAHAESPGEGNWSSVFEKARAALPGFGSYASLAGGSMLRDSPGTVAAALSSLTGMPAATQPARTVTLDQLRSALSAGRPVAATTFLAALAPPPSGGEVGMVDRHVYILEAIQGDQIVLRNPWGYDTAIGPEAVRLSIEQFNRRVFLATYGDGASRPAGRE